jgi:hypothetical protein
MKHLEHFKGLNPVNAMVTGTQARGFLMQSQLPPLVLAQIWSLADTDKDGNLNFIEFSIACKLITMKLKGLEVPKVLPPSMLPAAASPIMSPPVAAPLVGLSHSIFTQPAPVPVIPLASAPAIPNSLPQQLSRKASVSSQDGTPVVDWPVPQPSRLKYTMIFNQTDKNKTGYMTGLQARQLLMQTQLNQTTLAKVWSLADIDNDGRLGCEEFILAMHLTDMVKRGEQLPVKLTPELIPPSFRRQQARRMSGSASQHSGTGQWSISKRIFLWFKPILHFWRQFLPSNVRKSAFNKKLIT